MKYYKGMKKYQVLELAKRHLANTVEEVDYSTKFEFICHCINKVVHNEHMCFDDDTGLINFINQKLQNLASYASWLESKYGIAYWENTTHLQFSRHNWLDHMIKEFKDKDE